MTEGKALSNRLRTAAGVWLCMAVVLLSQTVMAQVRTSAHRVARINSRIDNASRTKFSGHLVKALQNAADMGRVPRNAAMNHLLMVLQGTPEQEQQLQVLIDQQLDKNNSNFHKWMTPEEFGDRFGVADSDIAQVADWMTQQGLTVESVPKSKRFIQFSGTVGQVEKAFQTEMHYFNVGGKTHISNSTEISVPTAIKPVVNAIPTLHNFFKTASFQDLGTVAEQEQAKIWHGDPFRGTPDFTSGSTHYFGAADFATVYNTKPLIDAGFDGTGVTIGIIARTDIHLEDVQIYRQMFNLKVNDPIFVLAGDDPGIIGGDDGESYLDAEVSGGAAPGATVKFVTAAPSLTVDGVDLSAMYVVQNNLTDIISESYGQCEANFTAAQAAFTKSLWQQAAAQGQTVFLSSGDNGPAGCDSANATFSSSGYAVSLLASTPYNIAVGGTMFSEGSGTYWKTTNDPGMSSALSYIPEIPWNEAKGSGATGAAGLWSGSGGISAYFQTPSWQRGFGVPLSDPAYPNRPTFSSPAAPFVPGPHRYLPDVSLAAASGHDGTLYCAEGVCQLSSTGSLVNAGIVGGTSVAAPTMAGVQALINHKNGGGRQGMAGYVYYSLADAQHTAGLNCASNAVGGPDANCAFRDITTGNTLVCGNSSCTATQKIGWTAVAGYDMATGLGSPNATAMATLWSKVNFNSSTVTLNLSQTSGILHGNAVTLSGAVAPGSGSGVPTGDVAFIVSSGALGNPVNVDTGGYQNPVSFATLSGGSYSVALSNLPAGTYNVYARYGGDSNFGSSNSAPVQVTVDPEVSTVTISPNAFNGTSCIETPSTTFTYGDYFWLDAIVMGASGQGIPTGTVALTDNSIPWTTLALNPNAYGHLLAGSISTSSCVYGYTFQSAAPLTGGVHVLGGTYSGDASFNSLNAPPVTVTINKATVTSTLTTSATNVGSGDAVQLNFTMAGLANAGPGTLSPSGTVTFTDTTTSTTLGTAVLNPTATFGALAVLTTNGITAGGAHSVRATFAGDNNYNTLNSSTVTVTVQSGAATAVALSSSANPAALGGRPTITATVTNPPSNTVTSGTVSFFENGVLLGTGAVGSGHTATYRPGTATNWPAGAHNVVAVYGGTATLNESTSPVFAQTISKATAATLQLTAKTSGTVGQTFTFSAAIGGTTVTSTPPTGTVQFFDGASPIGSPQPFTIVTATFGGYAIYQSILATTSLTAGTHTITAQWTDANYTAAVSNAQTVVVSKVVTAMAVTSASGAYGGSTNLTATLTSGGNPVSGKTVTFTVNSTGVGSAITGANGVATLSYNITIGGGTWPVVATFAGDSVYAPATGSNTLTVTALPAALVTTATLVKNGDGSYSATVSVKNTGGGTAVNVVLTAANLGTPSGTPIPQSLGDIAPGGTVTTTVNFPSSAGSSGATVVEKYSGTYTSGTFGTSIRAKLP